MQNDIAKIYKIWEDNITIYFDEYEKRIGTESINKILELIKEEKREYIHDHFYAFLDKYIGDTSFYDAIMSDKELSATFPLIARILHSEELYDSYINYVQEKSRDINILKPRVLETKAEAKLYLEMFPKGVNPFEDNQGLILFEEAATYLYFNSEYGDSIYEIEPNIIEIQVDRYLKGIQNLKEVTDLDAFTREILKNSDANVDKLIEDLLESHEENVSVLKNNNVVRSLYDKASPAAKPKVLTLASNPSKKMIDELPIDLRTYKIYSGDYQKSPYLVETFLKKGETTILSYAPSESINSAVIKAMEEAGIDITKLVNNENLTNSYYLNQALYSRGITTNIMETDYALNPDEAFDFMVKVFKDPRFVIPEDSYSHYSLNSLILSIIRKTNTDALHYSSPSEAEALTPHMLDVLIDEGLNYKHLASGLMELRNNEMVINAFIQKGDYKPLYFTRVNFPDELLDKLTYDEYIEVKEATNCYTNRKVMYKLVKEGHYDVIADFAALSESDIVEMGLGNITQEQYDELPQSVKNIREIKERVYKSNPAVLKNLLKESPDVTTIEKLIDLGEITYEELETILKENSSIDLLSKKILETYAATHKDIFKYSLGYSFNVNVAELFTKYYSCEEFNPKDYCNYLAINILIEFIKQGKTEVLENISSINISYSYEIKKLLEAGYNAELFLKYPVITPETISLFATKDNIHFIIDELKKHENGDIYTDGKFIIDLIRKGISIQDINELISHFSISLEKMINYMNEDEYHLLNELNFSTPYNGLSSKKCALIIINNVDVDRIKDYIFKKVSLNSELKNFMCNELISRGHYEFIQNYYGRFIPEDVLKTVLLNGYFPRDEFKHNCPTTKYYKNVTFTDSELTRIKSFLDTEPFFAIYIPNILDDINLTIDLISREPGLLNYLNIPYDNYDMIASIISKNPSISDNIYYRYNRLFACDVTKLNASMLAILIKIPESLEHIDISSFNASLITQLIPLNPNIINRVTKDIPDSDIKLAIDNGYKLSIDTNSKILSYYLKGNYEIDDNILKSKSFDELFKLLKDNYDEKDDSTKLHVIYTELIERDKEQFIYLIYKNALSDNMRFLTENILGITDEDNQYYKDSLYYGDNCFYLTHYLNTCDLTNPNIEELANVIHKYKVSSEFEETFIEYIFKNKLSPDLIKTIAEYSFEDYPAYFADFIDTTDPKWVNRAKELVFDNTKLLKKFKTLAEDRDLIIEILKNPKTAKYIPYKYYSDPYVFEKVIDGPVCNLLGFDFYNPEIVKIAIEHILDIPELFQYVSEHIEDKETIFKLLNKGVSIESRLNEKIATDPDVFLKILSVNPDAKKYFDYNNETIRNIAINNILDHPDLVTYVGQYIEDKDLIMKLFPKRNNLYYYLNKSIKDDFDIIKASMEYYSYTILLVSKDHPRLQELIDIDINLNANYEALLNNFNLTDENIFTIINKNPSLIGLIKIERINETLLNLIDFNDVTIVSPLADKLIVDPQSEIVQIFFNKIFASENVESNLALDTRLFKSLITIYKNNTLTIPNKNIKNIFDEAINLLNFIGKLNTIQNNGNFTYDLIKYVLPTFGYSLTKELLMFNTRAIENIITEVKAGNKDLLLNFYDFVCKNHIFDDDNKKCHYAFRYFDSIKPLVISIIDKKLTEEQIKNLRNVIIRHNPEKITTLEELTNYNEIRKNYIKSVKNLTNIIEIKEILTSLFGYDSFSDLKDNYEDFQLGNHTLINVCTEDIRKFYKEEAEAILESSLPTGNDTIIIALMERIIYSESSPELQSIAEELMKSDKIIDYSADVRNIIAKQRKLFTYQFNTKLSDVSKLKGTRLKKDDPENKYGVEIISLDTLEEFNFLSHTIHCYDKSMNDKLAMLIKDPTTWTKLEGASTLSTSSISDKNFNHVPGNVFYLFNNLPPDFILFMYPHDLFVQHGSYHIEPTANKNSFTTLDGLNQSTKSSYNEVAGVRGTIKPCAMLSFSKNIHEDLLRAAKSHNVPIIIVDKDAYLRKNEETYAKAKKEFEAKPTKELITKIFMNGVLNASSPKDELNNCLMVLNDHLKNKTITREDFLEISKEIVKNLKLICSDDPKINVEITKLLILVESYEILSAKKEGIIKKANMGESGIMFKYDTEDESYIIKPGIRKDGLHKEDFRAEVMKAASNLQSILSPSTTVEVTTEGKDFKLSVQPLIAIDKEKTEELSKWFNTNEPLKQEYADGLLKEYVVDFLLCNFDCFYGNFIVDKNGELKGIDKEQSFRFINDINTLNPDFSYSPNGCYRVPIYKKLFEDYKKGKISLDLSIITSTIDIVELIKDEDYRNLFKGYADATDHPDELLDKIVERKHLATEKIKEFVKELEENKSLDEGGLNL